MRKEEPSYDFPWDVAYVVNLDRRSDRWATAQQELHRAGIEAYRWSARDWLTLPKDWAGMMTKKVPREQNMLAHIACGLSHKDAMMSAKALGHSSVCIFEDDVLLAPNFNSVMLDVRKELPDDWQFLYLGHRPWRGHQATRYSDHLEIVSKTYDAHAYVVREPLITWLTYAWDPKGKTTDWFYQENMPHVVRYAAYPQIAWQDKMSPSETVMPKAVGGLIP